MRIAIIADIHGNIDALEAVLAHINKQNVDEIIVAGDIVIGLPCSPQCWTLIQSLGCVVIRGNHERYLFDYASPNAPGSWKTERYAPIRQAHQQFSKTQIEVMRALPAYYQIDDLLMVHASYRNDVDAVVETSSAEELETMFALSTSTYIIRAHNHVWFECEWNSKKLYSIGSVGLPLNGDTRAQYAVAKKATGTWKIEKHYVAYDLQKALRRFEESNYFNVAGPVGRLFRQELITAKHQLTPFWNTYTLAVDTDALTLEEAVEAYLRLR